MFELIPSLLAQQNAKQATVNPSPSVETASVPQQKTQATPLSSAPAVAIPESTPIPESTIVEALLEQDSPSSKPVTRSNASSQTEVKKAEAHPEKKAPIPQQSQPVQVKVTIAPQTVQTSQKQNETVQIPSSTPSIEPLPLQATPSQQSQAVESLDSMPALPAVRVSATPVSKLKPLEKVASKPKLKKNTTTIARTNSSVQKNLRSNLANQNITASALVRSTTPENSSNSQVIKSGVTLPKVRLPLNPPKIANLEIAHSEVQQNNRLPDASTPINPGTTLEQPATPNLLNSSQSVATFNPRRIEIVKPSPAAGETVAKSPSMANASKRPVKTTEPAIEREQQVLEQRLAEIVAKDRAAKQAKQQENLQQQREALVRQAYDYATQRRFDRARQVLQNPSLSQEDRDPVLVTINDLEIASRSLGVTKVAEAPPKPQSPSKTKVARTPKPSVPVIISELPTSLRSPKSATVIPVPTPLFRSQKVALRNPLPTPMSSDAGAVNDSQVVQVNPQNLQAYNRNLPGQNQRDKFLYPLPEPVPVTSKFGWRIHPVTRVKRLHSGVDLGAAQGTPILASKAGRVTIADQMGGYGLAIVLQHNDGSQDTLYAHLSQIFVRPGERIQPGMVIGKVGSTGVSTGPHLHYEARRMTNTGWVAYDPGPQLEAARVRLVQVRQMNARSTQPHANPSLDPGS